MKYGGYGKILLALVIIAFGVSDLGTSMGWWNFSIPFWPVVLILFGLWLLLHGIEQKVAH